LSTAGAGEEPLLTVTDLSVNYGATRALDRLNLTVRRDELFVLLGGSGSGKTTLLRAIGGFVRPHAGRIFLEGIDLSPMPPHRRPVNTMFQSYALFPHLTVAGNIGFGLRQRGTSRAETRARVAAMLTLVQLEGFADRRPHQLSGGQQQRVALARSLAPQPTLLLLDEPLSALDQGLRMETRVELVRLRRQLGTSFVLVTHDQSEALAMGDRIGVMRDGHMAQIGTPAELYERPVDQYVARFLGAANILACTVAPDGVTVRLPALGATVRAAQPGAPGPGLLVLRSERLWLLPSAAPESAHANPGGPNQLEGLVIACVYLGDTLAVTVQLRDQTPLRVTSALADGLDAAWIEPGSSVRVGWPQAASILLPP